LNGLGYGQDNSALVLNLVYNPVGESLPPAVDRLEKKYKEELAKDFGIKFHRLHTITNMPIHRFADDLVRQGKFDAYMSLLINHFNPITLDQVMCHSLLSIGWNGIVYDCDFNQMLEMPILPSQQKALTLDNIGRLTDLENLEIRTAQHCYGCTAGTGSSCGGSLV